MVYLINDKLKRIAKELENVKLDVDQHLDKDVQVKKLDELIQQLHEIRREIN